MQRPAFPPEVRGAFALSAAGKIWNVLRFALRIFSGKNIYNFAILENLRSLSGQSPSICLRKPLCRLKAPLGLSLLRKRGLFRTPFSQKGTIKTPPDSTQSCPGVLCYDL